VGRDSASVEDSSQQQKSKTGLTVTRPLLEEIHARTRTHTYIFAPLLNKKTTNNKSDNCYKNSVHRSPADPNMPTTTITTSSNDLPSSVRPAHPWCDVCWGSVNFKEMTFQRCRICQVGVHNQCYGIAGYEARVTDPNPEFECWACRAVGTQVKGRSRSGSGTKEFTVLRRPTECCLCGVDDKDGWYHAMHPVYDQEGVHGRPLILPPTREHPVERPAWAHTLCASTIFTNINTAGCVYACDAQGWSEVDDVDDDSDEKRRRTLVERENQEDGLSVNSELEGADTSVDSSTHRFGYCQPRRNGQENQWVKRIRCQQEELKCSLCGKKDNAPSSFRIPIQCSSKDASEHEALAAVPKSDCYVPMHVGCAAWGRDDIGRQWPMRRVFFFPGKYFGETRIAPVSNVYCEAHAEDLKKAGVPGSRIRDPDADLRENRARIATERAASSLSQQAGVRNPPPVRRELIEDHDAAVEQLAMKHIEAKLQAKALKKRSKIKQRLTLDAKNAQAQHDNTIFSLKSASSSTRRKERDRTPNPAILIERKKQRGIDAERRPKKGIVSGRIREDLEHHFRTVNPNDAQAVEDMRKTRHRYWHGRMKGSAAITFKSFWAKAWTATVENMKLTVLGKDDAHHNKGPPAAQARSVVTKKRGSITNTNAHQDLAATGDTTLPVPAKKSKLHIGSLKSYISLSDRLGGKGQEVTSAKHRSEAEASKPHAKIVASATLFTDVAASRLPEMESAPQETMMRNPNQKVAQTTSNNGVESSASLPVPRRKSNLKNPSVTAGQNELNNKSLTSVGLNETPAIAKRRREEEITTSSVVAGKKTYSLNQILATKKSISEARHMEAGSAAIASPFKDARTVGVPQIHATKNSRSEARHVDAESAAIASPFKDARTVDVSQLHATKQSMSEARHVEARSAAMASSVNDARSIRAPPAGVSRKEGQADEISSEQPNEIMRLLDSDSENNKDPSLADVNKPKIVVAVASKGVESNAPISKKNSFLVTHEHLAERLLLEIAEKEAKEFEHLDGILYDKKKEWQIKPQIEHFDEFWTMALEKVKERFNYDLKPMDWSKNMDTSGWDTYEVIAEGYP
jgi:hypothetical protein